MEYVQVFWKDAPEGEPSVIYYEVDTAAGRLGRRSMDVFADSRIVRHEDLYDGAIEVTPVPTVSELNSHVWGEEFSAREVTANEFEHIWSSEHCQVPLNPET